MSIKLKNTEAYMENYAKKLIRLLRKRMNTPIPSRTQRRFLNPVINDTGGSASRIQYSKDRSKSGLNIDIIGDEYLTNIDQGGTPKTGVQVQDIAEWIVRKPLGYRDVKGNVTTNLSSLAPQHPTVQSIARRITKKIESVGIEPTRFIEEASKEQLKNLKVIAPVVADVRENVQDILKEAGFDLDGKTIKFV